jgi:hypothetical protein
MGSRLAQYDLSSISEAPSCSSDLTAKANEPEPWVLGMGHFPGDPAAWLGACRWPAASVQYDGVTPPACDPRCTTDHPGLAKCPNRWGSFVSCPAGQSNKLQSWCKVQGHRRGRPERRDGHNNGEASGSARAAGVSASLRCLGPRHLRGKGRTPMKVIASIYSVG